MTEEQAQALTQEGMKVMRPFVLDKAVCFVMELTPEQKRCPGALAAAITEFALTHAAAAMLGTLRKTA